MSQEDQQRVWEALAEHGHQLEAMRRSVERIETAIAGNAALKQPGLVDRQQVVEHHQKAIEERLGRLEGRVVFVSGFVACGLAGWEAVKHFLKS